MKELPPTAQWGGGALYNSSTWLYPDYSTLLQVLQGLQGATLQGEYGRGGQGWGREGRLEAVRCVGGVLELRVKEEQERVHRWEVV